MNCIIVDDNKMARTAIKQMITQVDFLNLKHECENPIEAFNYLKRESIDLVFLDVEMPEMTGIELIKNLETRPIIIMITTKQEYAVEAFELNVADYLIKPVSMTRFMVAVARAKELFEKKDNKIEMSSDKDKEYIFVRSNSVLTKIRIKEIIYVQALGDYVNIFTADNKRHTVHITLKAIEEKLQSSKFFRLHRSYLVALDHIDNVEENTAYIGKHPLSIGEQYKKELLKKLNLI
ncbi:MAG: DNA-binding response regulator [Bacteroidetes bacterium]|jgi:two-component system LytT family response regulator|nr:DNA-binding response regulator [Bacteroidota bacterium]